MACSLAGLTIYSLSQSLTGFTGSLTCSLPGSITCFLVQSLHTHWCLLGLLTYWLKYSLLSSIHSLEWSSIGSITWLKIYWLTCSFTHSLFDSLTHSLYTLSLIDLLTYCLIHILALLIYWVAQSFNSPANFSLIGSLTYWLTHIFTKDLEYYSMKICWKCTSILLVGNKHELRVYCLVISR